MLFYDELSGGAYDSPLNPGEIDHLRENVWRSIDRWWGHNFRQDSLIGDGFQLCRRQATTIGLSALTLDVKCKLFPLEDTEEEPEVVLIDEEEPRRLCLAALEVSELHSELKQIIISLALNSFRTQMPEQVAKVGEEVLLERLQGGTAWNNHYYYFDSDDHDHATVHHQMSLKDRYGESIWHEGLTDYVVPHGDDMQAQLEALEGMAVENSKIFLVKDRLHLVSALASLGLAVL